LSLSGVAPCGVRTAEWPKKRWPYLAHYPCFGPPQ
jgi:hypothetical protein